MAGSAAGAWAAEAVVEEMVMVAAAEAHDAVDVVVALEAPVEALAEAPVAMVMGAEGRAGEVRVVETAVEAKEEGGAEEAMAVEAVEPLWGDTAEVRVVVALVVAVKAEEGTAVAASVAAVRVEVERGRAREGRARETVVVKAEVALAEAREGAEMKSVNR